MNCSNADNFIVVHIRLFHDFDIFISLKSTEWHQTMELNGKQNEMQTKYCVTVEFDGFHIPFTWIENMDMRAYQITFNIYWKLFICKNYIIGCSAAIIVQVEKYLKSTQTALACT